MQSWLRILMLLNGHSTGMNWTFFRLTFSSTFLITGLWLSTQNTVSTKSLQIIPEVFIYHGFMVESLTMSTIDWSLKPKLASVVDDPSAVRAMTVEDCNEIYSKVFFEHLTVEQLEEAYENPHVPRNLLCEGMFISLRMALGKPVNQERLGRTYTKHMDTKRGRDFVYVISNICLSHESEWFVERSRFWYKRGSPLARNPTGWENISESTFDGPCWMQNEHSSNRSVFKRDSFTHPLIFHQANPLIWYRVRIYPLAPCHSPHPGSVLIWVHPISYSDPPITHSSMDSGGTTSTWNDGYSKAARTVRHGIPSLHMKVINWEGSMEHRHFPSRSAKGGTVPFESWRWASFSFKSVVLSCTVTCYHEPWMQLSNDDNWIVVREVIPWSFNNFDE